MMKGIVIMKKFIVEGHEPSLLPDNMDFNLAWHDEFDGNSNAIFSIYEKDGEICSSQI